MGKFIPHAETWLNNRRWEDELEVKQDGEKYLDHNGEWQTRR